MNYTLIRNTINIACSRLMTVLSAASKKSHGGLTEGRNGNGNRPCGMSVGIGKGA